MPPSSATRDCCASVAVAAAASCSRSFSCSAAAAPASAAAACAPASCVFAANASPSSPSPALEFDEPAAVAQRAQLVVERKPWLRLLPPPRQAATPPPLMASIDAPAHSPPSEPTLPQVTIAPSADAGAAARCRAAAERVRAAAQPLSPSSALRGVLVRPRRRRRAAAAAAAAAAASVHLVVGVDVALERRSPAPEPVLTGVGEEGGHSDGSRPVRPPDAESPPSTGARIGRNRATATRRRRQSAMGTPSWRRTRRTSSRVGSTAA